MTLVRTILITVCSTGSGWLCAIGMKACGWQVFAMLPLLSQSQFSDQALSFSSDFRRFS